MIMNIRLKQRLIGAIIILALLVIFIPMLFRSHDNFKARTVVMAPAAPAQPNIGENSLATTQQADVAESSVQHAQPEFKTTKEIAELLNASKRAIEFHRNNLREKFALKNRKANLRSHLLSIS